jgi:glucose-1-phosphate adenylyltransferase
MTSPSVTSIVLAGGQGRRLHPLTKSRSKPAVPIGGKFRLIDIPISNCLHHGIRNIWVLTQFASESLHRHIFQSYRLDSFSGGFVSVLAASQTVDNRGWYEGTADAVRKNIRNFSRAGDAVLLLSGDHLYRMDFARFIKFHYETGADISLAVQTVEREKVKDFGIMKLDQDFRVIDFIEKPTNDDIIHGFEIPREIRNKSEFAIGPDRTHLGSMGIYLFKTNVLFDLLAKYPSYHDFGRQIIPAVIKDHRVLGYPFSGYWEDIGTIKAFFNSHIDMTKPNPPFDFYDQEKPIFTRARFLPATKISGSKIDSSIICEGCMIEHSAISDSVVGLRAVIKTGSVISKSIIMGADFYETEHNGGAGMGIGRNCRIQNAILDKDVRIGDDVQLINREGILDARRDGIVIRDGIIIVPKSAVIPSGYVL